MSWLLKFGISRCHVCLSDLQWSGCGEHADNNSSNLSVKLSQNTEWLGKTKKIPVTITLHPYFAALYVSLNEVYSAIKKGKTKTSGITLTCTFLPYVPLRQDMVHALWSSRPHSGLFIEYIYKNIISLLMDWWPSPNMGNLPQFWLLSGGHAAKSHTGRLAGKGYMYPSFDHGTCACDCRLMALLVTYSDSCVRICQIGLRNTDLVPKWAKCMLQCWSTVALLRSTTGTAAPPQQRLAPSRDPTGPSCAPTSRPKKNDGKKPQKWGIVHTVKATIMDIYIYIYIRIYMYIYIRIYIFMS